jgi:hypothetical protein
MAKNQPKARPPRGSSTKGQPRPKKPGSPGGTMTAKLNRKPSIGGGKGGAY